MLIYQPECAYESLGFNIDADSGSKVYGPGYIEKDSQLADGEYEFATRPLNFENTNLEPRRDSPADKNMWSFDNPDLVDDVTDWVVETPNIYYAGAVVLVLLILLIACVCCCCRCCCSSSQTKVVSEQVTKDEINRFEKAKQQIKVKDVLNE